MEQKASRLFCIVASLFCALCTALQAAGDFQEYHVSPITTIVSGSDPPYALIDEKENEIPPTLLGLKLSANGFYICDGITDRLIKLDFDGNEVFSVGSKGTGPEDHIGPGEPIAWPGCAIARTDCSTSPKLICYDEHGGFLRSIKIDGFHQYLRILRGAKHGFGLALVMNWLPGGEVDLEVHLAAISDEGAVIHSELITTKRLDYSKRPKEEDFEIAPRLLVDGTGRLYMQRNVYVWDIECYDEDLNLIWSHKKNTKLTPRSSDERQRRDYDTRGLIPATHHHAIRQIFARPDGEVWVQETDKNSLPGEIRLTRLDSLGRDVGEVIIKGLPKEEGDILIVDNRLVWKRDDDVQVQEDQPYLAVFMLVPAH